MISDLFKALSFDENGIIKFLTATLLRSCCENSRLLESGDMSGNVFRDIAKDRNGSN
jgi:hypothetical protein